MRGTGYLLSWYFYWHFHQDNHPHQMKNQINIFSLKRVQKITGGVLILTSEIYAAAYAQGINAIFTVELYTGAWYYG